MTNVTQLDYHLALLANDAYSNSSRLQGDRLKVLSIVDSSVFAGNRIVVAPSSPGPGFRRLMSERAMPRGLRERLRRFGGIAVCVALTLLVANPAHADFAQRPIFKLVRTLDQGSGRNTQNDPLKNKSISDFSNHAVAEYVAHAATRRRGDPDGVQKWARTITLRVLSNNGEDIGLASPLGSVVNRSINKLASLVAINIVYGVPVYNAAVFFLLMARRLDQAWG